jgi:hypothetical protein
VNHLPGVFIISDSIGETAEMVVRAAASQFNSGEMEIRQIPNISNTETIDEVIHQAANNKFLVAYTLVIDELAIQTSIKRLIKQGLGSFAVEHLGPPLQANTGSLRLMDPLIQPYDHDYALILIGIEDYKPDSRHIQDLQENWHFGSVIDFWEVDLDYDGETFYSQVQILRNKKHYDSSLQLSIKLKLPLQDTYRIAIRVYDLFGDSQMESLLVEAGSRGR